MDPNDFVELSETWRNKVEDSVTLQRGTQYFHQRRVRITRYTRKDHRLILNARVKSGSSKHTYDVAIQLQEEGTVAEYSCTCPAHDHYDGLCKHCVATLLAYDEIYRIVSTQFAQGKSAREGNAPLPSARRNGNAVIPETGRKQAGATAITALRQSAARGAGGLKNKAAFRRSAEVLARYRQLILREVQAGDPENGPAYFVTLVPILDCSDLRNGVLLSLQIRRKNEEERVADGRDGEAAGRNGEENRGDPNNVGFETAEKTGEQAGQTAVPTLDVRDFPRAYVIKSIGFFLQSVKNRWALDFGVNLSIRPGESSFDETAWEWIRFLFLYYSDCMMATQHYADTDRDRQIRLTGAALDDLFSRFEHGWFRADGTAPVYQQILSGEEPRLEIALEGDPREGVTLLCGEMDNVYIAFDDVEDGYDNSYRYNRYDRHIGSDEKKMERPFRHVYVWDGARLRRYPTKASRTLMPLIMALKEAKGMLEFPGEQCDDLFDHLLPEVSKYLTVRDPQGLFTQRQADTMTGKILLDAPDREHLTVTLMAGYHDLWLNPYSGKAVAKTEPEGNPDPRREADAPAQPLTCGDGSVAAVNWDATGLDTRGLRRDYHAEQRLLVETCYILGLPKEEILARLTAQGKIENPAEQPLIVAGEEQMYRLLTTGVPKLQGLGDVFVTGKMRRLTVEKPQKITVGVTLNSGLLRLNIDAGGVDLEELHRLLNAYHEKKRYYRLKNGRFINLENSGEAGKALESMAELSKIEQGLQISEDALESDGVEVPAFRALYLDGLFNDAASLGFRKDRAFESLTTRIRDFAHAGYQVPESLKDVLREYQKTGYQWMRSLEACSFCGILADDMGLGKSIQFIALLLAYYGEGTAEAAQNAGTETDTGRAEQEAEPKRPSLIVCPSSLVLNWEKEIQKFGPSLRVRMIQGTAATRAARIRDIRPDEVAITSYDSLKRDLDAYADVTFQYCALDEAQYIKNHTTQAARAVKKIVCRQRFALTGTPIENRLSELWSIFDFLMPGYLYRYARFKECFELPIERNGDEAAKENLRRMILPFMLRRMKADVLTELPPKTTTVVPVELSPKHREVYHAMLMTGLNALKADPDRAEGVAKIQVLALLTRLRRLCCDPSLCFDAYKQESSKLEACMELLSQAKEGGHHVLLFSQYTDMLEILERRIRETGMSVLRLQGSTPVKDRLARVDAFNRGETDVFLISLRAGGTGLNLTAADTVIHYDPWWNVAAQDQATDRAYRIGQDKKVQVYKLIAQGTIEEKILHLQEMKSDLAAMIESESEEGGLMAMSTEQIIELLQNR